MLSTPLFTNFSRLCRYFFLLNRPNHPKFRVSFSGCHPTSERLSWPVEPISHYRALDTYDGRYGEGSDAVSSEFSSLNSAFWSILINVVMQKFTFRGCLLTSSEYILMKFLFRDPLIESMRRYNKRGYQYLSGVGNGCSKLRIGCSF